MIVDNNLEDKFILKINNYVNKIDSSINGFRFNVSVALFYEIYRHLRDHLEKNISNKIMRTNTVKIMKLMIPFTPHLAHECLEMFKCESANTWPKIEKDTIEEIKLAIQVNGKTRDIINIKKNLIEKEITQIIKRDSKAKKYLENKKIIKTIFVKNKIINYIVN